MSWLYSQALVEEYLGDTSLDGEQSVQLNGNPTQQAYCAPGKMTDFSRLSRSGMTFKPLTESLGKDLLTLYLEAFHAKTSQLPETEQELKGKEVECGAKWHGSFVKYDPDSSLWRTHQCSFLGDLEPFLETWPRWGLMRNGECWEQQTLVQITNETESGSKPRHSLPTPTCNPHLPNLKANTNGPKNLMQVANGEWEHLMPPKQIWPTPCSTDYKGSGKTGDLRDRLDYAAERGATKSKQYADPPKAGGKLNPTWVEWLMGWPLGWTDLKPLETDKSHYAPPQLGDC